MPLQVSLVRHAQTTMNLEKRIQTRTDAPLSKTGIWQAESVAKRLCFDMFSRVYTSDKRRAVHTAETILQLNRNNVKPIFQQDLRLRERDFGEWELQPEAMMFAEAKRLGVQVNQLQPPGGEDRIQFARKGLDFFLELCELTELENNQVEDEHVLVVSHVGWLITLLENLGQHPGIFKLVADEPKQLLGVPKNTSLTRMTVVPSEDEGYKYEIRFSHIFDDTHLEQI